MSHPRVNRIGSGSSPFPTILLDPFRVDQETEANTKLRHNASTLKLYFQRISRGSQISRVVERDLKEPCEKQSQTDGKVLDDSRGYKANLMSLINKFDF